MLEKASGHDSDPVGQQSQRQTGPTIHASLLARELQGIQCTRSPTVPNKRVAQAAEVVLLRRSTPSLPLQRGLRLAGAWLALGLVGLLGLLTASVGRSADGRAGGDLEPRITTDSYTETFAGTRYRDPLQTTAWWDTAAAEIKLYPLGITLEGNFDTADRAYDVLVDGNYAYVVDNGLGLQVIDVGTPDDPILAGSQDTPGNARGIALAGGYAYVADGIAGLLVIDVSNPTAPDSVGSAPSDAFAHDVAVAGGFAFLAQSGAGLLVVDVNDPAQPQPVIAVATGDWAQAVTVADGLAYVAGGNAGLQIFDVSVPGSPVLLGSYDTPGYARGVAIAAPYAYVADGGGGLLVLDVSVPAVPDSVAAVAMGGNAQAVAISGVYAYVAAGTSGLQAVDIANPTQPFLSGGLATGGEGYSLDARGDHAYLADGAPGLQIIALSPDGFNTDANVVQSLALDAGIDPIVRARLNTVQVDSVRWRLSTDGGTNWQEFWPGADWQDFAVSGDSLLWRCSLHYLGGPQSPGCSRLHLEWEKNYSYPEILSVADVPQDHGLQVRITFAASRFDVAGSTQPITEYAVFRRIDPDLKADGTMAPANSRGGIPSLPVDRAYPPGDWDYLLSIPADAEETYNSVVPTLKDATLEHGIYYSVFFARARTDTPGIYFDSPPDSGYSMDNDLPTIPGGFAASYHASDGNLLSWQPSPDDDFQDFRIYRDTDPDFTPAPGNLAHTSTDTVWLDVAGSGWDSYYLLTASNLSGLESIPTPPVTWTAIPVLPPQPSLRLWNEPNPFNPQTTIRYRLPAATSVAVRIYDARGRLVRSLFTGKQVAGPHTINWDGRDLQGRSVSSGTYFCLLQAGRQRSCHKLALIR